MGNKYAEIRKTANTGVRLSDERMAKLVAMAKELSVSRNEVIGLLIDAAKIESRPSIILALQPVAGQEDVEIDAEIV